MAGVKSKVLAIAKATPKLKPLSVTERFFVAHLMKDPKRNLANAYAALETDAGEGSCATCGSEMAARPHVAAAIEKHIEEKLTALSVTPNYVLGLIKKVTDASADIAVVSRNVAGEKVTVAVVRDPASALKGAELMGKHLKMFVDRSEVSGPNGGPIQNENTSTELTKEQLQEAAAARGLPTNIFQK